MFCIPLLANSLSPIVCPLIQELFLLVLGSDDPIQSQSSTILETVFDGVLG
jgi:hypothetical protein